ncbi:hypothetical protein [Salmonella phage SSBI34]|nr:hypothetical protein [Salmonella phage SSBI34]
MSNTLIEVSKSTLLRAASVHDTMIKRAEHLRDHLKSKEVIRKRLWIFKVKTNQWDELNRIAVGLIPTHRWAFLLGYVDDEEVSKQLWFLYRSNKWRGFVKYGEKAYLDSWDYEQLVTTLGFEKHV